MLQKALQIRLNVKIHQLRIFKHVDIFSGEFGFIPILVKFYELDQHKAKYYFYQLLALWPDIFSEKLIEIDASFWDSLCANRGSPFLRDSICDVVMKLFHLYNSKNCFEILSKLCSAFTMASNNLVLNAVSIRPLEDCLPMLSRDFFKLGMLLCKTNRLLNGEEEMMAIELTNIQSFAFINSVLKRIHQEINNHSICIQGAILCNVAQLLKISTLTCELWTKYAIFFCHVACQIEVFDVCKSISDQILENEQSKNSESFLKLLYLLGGTLFRKQRFSDSIGYLNLLINLSKVNCDPPGYVSKLELLSSAYFKDKKISESRKSLKLAIELCAKFSLEVEKLKLLATRWCSLAYNSDNIDMPVLENQNAFQIVFDCASVKLRDRLFENTNSDDPAICYLRHYHWMWKWKTGDVGLYHRDSVALRKRFHDSEYWTFVFQLLEQIWCHPLRKVLDLSAIILYPKEIDDRCQFLLDVLYNILNLTEDGQNTELFLRANAKLFTLPNFITDFECLQADADNLEIRLVFLS
jgi:hypothetical protein